MRQQSDWLGAGIDARPLAIERRAANLRGRLSRVAERRKRFSLPRIPMSESARGRAAGARVTGAN